MPDDSNGMPFASGVPVREIQKKRSVKKNILAAAAFLILITAGVFLWQKRSEAPDPVGPTQGAPIVAALPEQAKPVSFQEVDTGTILPSLAQYESEHFRVGEIAIGGEAGLIVPESDTAPLEILTVRGESFTEKGKNGAKLVITWETNKPAISEVSYGKGVGQAEGVIREESYGTNHSLIIPDLAQASTYVYVISSHDKWGNVAESEPYAVYTGAREVSLFELIAGAVGDVFGWAVDR